MQVLASSSSKGFRMNRHQWQLVILLGVLTTGHVPADENADQVRLAQQLRDAARKTYEKTWANYREGRAPADLLYRWSKRWLAAEKQVTDRPADRVAACKAHWERMRELEQLVRGL